MCFHVFCKVKGLESRVFGRLASASGDGMVMVVVNETNTALALRVNMRVATVIIMALT